MSDEVSIREFDVEYGPTIASAANREVDSGFEIDLRAIRVHVQIGDMSDSTTSFEVAFSVDHEAHAVEFSRVGDAYDKQTTFDPRQVMLATEVAGRAVAAWLDDVGVPYAAPEHAITVPTADSEPIVHTDLTVMDR